MIDEHEFRWRKAILALATLAWLIGLSGCSLFSARPGTRSGVDDQAIEAQIRTTLARNPQWETEALQVQSVEGVVELTGRVRSLEIKSQMGLAAAATPGVIQVRNDLLVIRSGRE